MRFLSSSSSPSARSSSSSCACSRGGLMTDRTTALNELALAHATKTYARLRPEETVDEALRSIPEQALDTAITYFYVVDASGGLRGVVPTRRLLTAPRDARVAELMTDVSVSLPM